MIYFLRKLRLNAVRTVVHHVSLHTVQVEEHSKQEPRCH